MSFSWNVFSRMNEAILFEKNPCWPNSQLEECDSSLVAKEQVGPILRMQPVAAVVLVTNPPSSKIDVITGVKATPFLCHFPRAVGPLVRTSKWQDENPGGLEHLGAFV